MTQSEIKEYLFKEWVKDFDVNDFFDQHGDTTQPFDFTSGYEYQDEENGWHNAYMDVVGAIYMKESKTEYQNPIEYGVPENVSDGNTIDDWEILSVSIYIDGKDITKTEDLQTLKNLLD